MQTKYTLTKTIQISFKRKESVKKQNTERKSEDKIENGVKKEKKGTSREIKDRSDPKKKCKAFCKMAQPKVTPETKIKIRLKADRKKKKKTVIDSIASENYTYCHLKSRWEWGMKTENVRN